MTSAMTKNMAQLCFYSVALAFLFLPISAQLCGIFIAISLVLMCLQIHKYSWQFLHKRFILIVLAFLVTLAYGLTYSSTPSANLHFLSLYSQLALIIVLIPILMKFSKEALQLPKLYLLGCMITLILLLGEHAQPHSGVLLGFGAYLAYTLAKSNSGSLRRFYGTVSILLLVGALYAMNVLQLWQNGFIHFKDDNILNAQNALQLWKGAPIIGHGTGSFVAAYYNNQLLPQNTFCTLLINNGLLGLALFLGMLVYLLQSVYLQKDTSLRHIALVLILFVVVNAWSFDILLANATRLWLVLWFAYCFARAKPI